MMSEESAAATVNFALAIINVAADGDRVEKATLVTEVVARWLHDYPAEQHDWLLEKLVGAVKLVNDTHPPMEGQGDG